MKQWNPRFVFYAKTQGRTPEEQIEHDRKEWPGGIMTGFILWRRKQHSDYTLTCPRIKVCGEMQRDTTEAGFKAWMERTHANTGMTW